MEKHGSRALDGKYGAPGAGTDGRQIEISFNQCAEEESQKRIILRLPFSNFIVLSTRTK
jgi:hypothetical protein